MEEWVEEDPHRHRAWWIALALVLLALAGLAAFLLTRPDKQTVPSVVGQSLTVAQTRLQNEGFKVDVIRRTSDRPKDDVIAQDPSPGNDVKKGETVTLTVSDGPGTAAVPDVAGQSQDRAVKGVKEAGFKATVHKQHSDEIKSGNAISTSPPAGSELDKGRTVIVNVSTGSAPVSIPDVVGEDRGAARSDLANAGFQIAEGEQESDQTPGTVLSQSPSGGTTAAKGSTVKIVIAKEKQVSVPDVTGLSSEDAVNKLSDAGFQPQVRKKDVTKPSQDDTVLSQSPGSGSKQTKGAKVVITVGRFNPDVTPNEQNTTPTTPTDAVDGRRRDRMRVAVLSGGRSSEHEVSLSSGAAVREALAGAGHDVLDVRIDRDGAWSCDGRAIDVRPGAGLLDADAVFPALHGPYGEDGVVQGLLECLDVPYAGSGVLGSALCMDKVLAKDVLAAAGTPQVDYVALRDGEDRGAARDRAAALGFPLFVKPARLGSSVGIAKVGADDELDAALEAAFAHDPLVIAEAMAPGIEVECAVLDGAPPTASVPGEIVIEADSEFYDYEAKYTPGGMDLVVPARISDRAAAELRRLAVDAFVRLGCAGLARADFFVDGETVLLNELNTMPGFTPTSVYARLQAAEGLDFASVLERLLALARERHSARRTYAA